VARTLIGDHHAHERTAQATINTPRFCQEKGDLMDTAQQIVTHVAHGDFAAVEQRLSDRLKPFLPAGTIQATWQGVMATWHIRSQNYQLRLRYYCWVWNSIEEKGRKCSSRCSRQEVSTM
jgi:hypothetical protein